MSGVNINITKDKLALLKDSEKKELEGILDGSFLTSVISKEDGKTGSVSYNVATILISKLYSKTENFEYISLIGDSQNKLNDSFATIEKNSEKNYIIFLGSNETGNNLGHFISAKAKKDSNEKVTLYIADSYETDNGEFGSSYTNSKLVQQENLNKNKNVEVKRVHVDKQYEYTCFFHALMNLQKIFLEDKIEGYEQAKTAADDQNLHDFKKLIEGLNEETEHKENDVKVVYRKTSDFQLMKLEEILTNKDEGESYESISCDDFTDKIKIIEENIGTTVVERKVTDEFVEYNFTVEECKNNKEYAKYFLNKLKLLSQKQNGQNIDLNLEGLKDNGKVELKKVIEDLLSSNKEEYKFINIFNEEYDIKSNDEPQRDSNGLEDKKTPLIKKISNEDISEKNIRKIVDEFVAKKFDLVTLDDDANQKIIDILLTLSTEPEYKNIEFMVGEKELKTYYKELKTYDEKNKTKKFNI